MMSNVTSRHPNHGWILRWIPVSTLSVFGSEAIAAEPGKDARREASPLPAGKSEAAVDARDIRTFVRESKCFCTHECNMSINLLFNSAAYPPIAGEMMREAARLSLIPGHGASPEPAASALAPQAQAQATLHREAGVAPIRMPTRRKS